MTQTDFIKWCYEQHDVVCNQKYDGLLYSFHLKRVIDNFNKFKHLLKSSERPTAIAGCAGHDLLEDARITYNQLKDIIGLHVTEVCYLCTEEKGRTREDRHSDKYLSELAENEIAIFVKLCDIMANVKYSMLTNSSMFDKYKKEYDRVKSFLFVERFAPMFTELEHLLTIK